MKDETRTRAELQLAHDMLIAVLFDQAPLFPAYTKRDLNVAASVLCWALLHNHNPQFLRLLVEHEQLASAQGLTLEKGETTTWEDELQLTTGTPEQTLLTKHGWQWHVESVDGYEVIELRDREERVLAWINRRPGYCDRGHWQVGVECVPYLDEADAFPRYFMRLEVAKQELVEFLAWRLFKSRVE
jgi:hypothetical protein